MRIISRKALVAFWAKHPIAKNPLSEWFERTTGAEWASFADVRQTFRHADLVRVPSGRTVVVFNVGGNKYRLVAAVHYNAGKVFVLRVFTHPEYDSHPWKEQL